MDFADSLDTTHPTATLPGVYDDVIVIRNLSCNTVTGLDEWGAFPRWMSESVEGVLRE